MRERRSLTVRHRQPVAAMSVLALFPSSLNRLANHCSRPLRRAASGRVASLRRAFPATLAALVALVAPIPISGADQSVVRFGIFPSQSIVPCSEDIDWRYVGPIEKLLAQREDAELGYSFYTRGPNGYSYRTQAPGTAVQPSLRGLWSDNVARREPILENVRAAARELELDAAVMAWIRCNQRPRHPPHLYRVEIYVIDVDQGRVYREQTPATWAGQAATKAIRELLADR